MASLLYLVTCPDARVSPAAYLGFFHSKALVKEANPTLVLSGDEEVQVYAKLFTDLLGVKAAVMNYRWDRMHTGVRKQTNVQLPGILVQSTPDFGVETREDYIRRLQEEIEPKGGEVAVVLISQTVMDDIATLKRMDSGIALLVICKDTPIIASRIRSFVNFSTFHAFPQDSLKQSHLLDSPHKEAVWSHLTEMKEAIVAGLREELQSSSRTVDTGAVLLVMEGRVAHEVQKVAARLQEVQVAGLQQIQTAAVQLVTEAKAQFDKSRDQLEGRFRSLRKEQAEVLKALSSLQQALEAPQGQPDIRKIQTRISQYEEVNSIVQEQLLTLQDTAPEEGLQPPANPPIQIPQPAVQSKPSVQPFRSGFQMNSMPQVQVPGPSNPENPSFKTGPSNSSNPLLKSGPTNPLNPSFKPGFPSFQPPSSKFGPVPRKADPPNPPNIPAAQPVIPGKAGLAQAKADLVRPSSTGMMLTIEDVVLTTDDFIDITVRNNSTSPVEGVVIVLEIPNPIEALKDLTISPGSNTFRVRAELIPAAAKNIDCFFTKDNLMISDKTSLSVESDGEENSAPPQREVAVHPPKEEKPAPSPVPPMPIAMKAGPLPFVPAKPGPIGTMKPGAFATLSKPGGLSSPFTNVANSALPPGQAGVPKPGPLPPFTMKSMVAGNDQSSEHTRKINEVVVAIGSEIRPEIRELITKLVKDPGNARLGVDQIIEMVFSQPNQ